MKTIHCTWNLYRINPDNPFGADLVDRVETYVEFPEETANQLVTDGPTLTEHPDGTIEEYMYTEA